MDTLLVDGDFSLDNKGFPIAIEGLQEILQRVLIRLTCKKGSFIYDRQLGSKLYTLKANYKDYNSLKGQALEFSRQALEPMPYVKISDIEISSDDFLETLIISLTLNINSESTQLEVKI